MKIKTEEIHLLREFIAIVGDILHSEEFGKMKKYRHHVNGSLYDHSIKVAYLCFKHHKRFGLQTDIAEFVRGAILHDFYLYDLHDETVTHKLHWFRHPETALQNAVKRYPVLTPMQKDMIKHHMFPLTPIPPTTSAGWLVCLYDKAAAISDRFGENKWEITKLPFENRDKGTVYNNSETFQKQNAKKQGV